MAGGFPDGCNQAVHDRAFCGSDANELQRALEERAEDEARDGSDLFRDWLCDNTTANGGGGIALVCAACTNNRGWADKVADARRALIAEYVAYRVNSFAQWEIDEIAAGLREAA